MLTIYITLSIVTGKFTPVLPCNVIFEMAAQMESSGIKEWTCRHIDLPLVSPLNRQARDLDGAVEEQHLLAKRIHHEQKKRHRQRAVSKSSQEHNRHLDNQTGEFRVFCKHVINMVFELSLTCSLFFCFFYLFLVLFWKFC